MQKKEGKGKYIARLMRQTENGNRSTLQVSTSDGNTQPGQEDRVKISSTSIIINHKKENNFKNKPGNFAKVESML